MSEAPAASAAGRVVVVGSINVDTVITTPHLPAPGETILGARVSQGFGGKGANQACAAAAHGPTTIMVGAVGSDPLGAAAVDDLTAQGVDATQVAVTDGPTGQAYVMVDQAGENSILVVPGANALLTAGAVSRRLTALVLSPADVVLTSGEIDLGSISAAAHCAADAGAVHVHNLAPFHVPEDRLLVAAPVIVANALEAQQATGHSDTSAAARALAARGRAGIVTRGADGALIAIGEEVHAVPAPPVVAVDTTGAGDAFCGALAAALSRGKPLRAATRTAILAGSEAVTAVGARGAVAERRS